MSHPTIETSTIKPAEPEGFRYFDSGYREKLLAYPGQEMGGWIFSRLPNGQWEPLRCASIEDYRRVGRAIEKLVARAGKEIPTR